MIIRALSVFEHVIYHSCLVDGTHPCQPHLEVDAVLRPGDADQGPLLLPMAEYIVLAGGPDRTRGCLDKLRQQHRIVDHLGVAHVSFPFWTPVQIEGP